MAEAALSFAVERLGDLAIHKVSSLLNIDAQVMELKDELCVMQRFLKDAAEKQAHNESVRGWISDIREVAFDAEDVVESFTLEIDSPRRRRRLLTRCALFPKHVYHVNRLGQEIKSIQKRLQDIDKRRARYGIRILEEERMVTSTRVERRRRVSPWQPDKNVVGLKKHVETILQKGILVEEVSLSIASIVGMGGIGKSTLAKAVYNHAAVRERFDSLAWVTVSSYFSPTELLKKLALQLKPREGEQTNIENLPEESLENMVHERLKGTKYFIVVDDVWRQQDWEYIARAFPDERDKASRLLITSRNHNIPRNAQYAHKLKGLDADESWELFLKAACLENNDGKYPQKLDNIGKKIVEKCSGLPLAITVMAGLLMEQGQSVNAWENVWKGMKSHLEAGEDSVSAVLGLSYQDLPPHLKSCFLCLSFFDEDARIDAQRLIKLWIAEGIVPQEGGETAEEKAETYLDELINRNMVHAIELSSDSQVLSCQMHDLLRDISIVRAKEEINFDMLRKDNASDQSLGQARHLSIFCNDGRFMLARSLNPHLRSLILHTSTRGGNSIPPRFWKKLGCCLRVLEVDGSGLVEVPQRIGKLIGLKYFRLQNGRIQKLPRSFGHLTNLQTLDLFENACLEVPNVIWKLHSLHHLHMPFNTLCEEPLKLDTLKNLQTLGVVSTKNIVVDHLEKIVSLRELGLVLTRDVDVSRLFTLLANLENLISLDLFWSTGDTFALDMIVNLRHLTRLYSEGQLTHLPQFSQNLSHLDLCRTHLNEDPMPLLGRLPNLLHLKLYVVEHICENMLIEHDSFPRLRALYLERLWSLRQIYIKSKGLPILKQLSILECPNLELLLEEEEKRMIGNLQELKISCAHIIVSKLKGDDYSHIISNIPSVVLH